MRAPVDVAAQRAATAAKPPLRERCPPPAHLPQTLTSIGFYTDPQYSKVDPDKEKQFEAAIAPIRDAESALSHILSAYVKASADAQPALAQCLLGLLREFAADHAMISTTEMRGTGQVRLLATTPIFVYVVLRENASIPPADRASIEDWIRHVADLIVGARKTFPYRNNIDYWGGAALAVAAVALQDRSLLDAALEVARTAAQEVTAEGTLPREMARGDRALEYSLSATQALSVIWAVAERNGVQSIRTFNQAAIPRLTRTMARAVIEPASFVALSGDPATVDPQYVYEQGCAWAAFAQRFVDDRNVRAVACKFSPLLALRAGGEWMTYFGDPAACVGHDGK